RDRQGHVRSDKKYTYRRYICGQYNAHGKIACQCNTIPERHLLRAVIRRIQQDFLCPDNLKKLTEELHRQASAKRQSDPEKAKQLKAQIAKLDRKIDQGNERLLLLPADLLVGASAKVRKWQEERDALRKQLAQHEGSQKVAAGNVRK